MTTLEIESVADDGLLGLVKRAEQAVLEQTTDPVGLLRIGLVEPGPDFAAVAVEASFVERGGAGVVERLDVDLAKVIEETPPRDQLLSVVGSSGDVAYTSICLRSAERELADVTLHYGWRIRLIGRCTALSASALGSEDVAACQHVLSALGVRSSAADGELRVSGRRFGGAPTSADQVEALLRARERGLDVELYASTLPVTRSVRLALGEGRLLCTVSRQIPADATSIARDAVALRELVEKHLGFAVGAQRWRVDNAHGERREHRPHGPMGGGQGVQWSLNWGARRR